MFDWNMQLTGRPVRALQTYLRELSVYYQIPTIVPDGIFGTKTKASVEAFQKLMKLPSTGVVDRVTWDVIIKEYTRVMDLRQPPETKTIFPSYDYVIAKGDSNEIVYTMQNLLRGLSNRFSQFPNVQLTGTHDDQSIAAVQYLQQHSGLPVTGELDRATWDALAAAHHCFVHVFPKKPLDSIL